MDESRPELKRRAVEKGGEGWKVGVAHLACIDCRNQSAIRTCDAIWRHQLNGYELANPCHE